VQREVKALDPNLPVSNVRMMNEVVAKSSGAVKSRAQSMLADLG